MSPFFEPSLMEKATSRLYVQGRDLNFLCYVFRFRQAGKQHSQINYKHVYIPADIAFLTRLCDI